MEIIDTIKAHPIVAVVAGIVLVWGLSRVLGNSSGGNTSDPNVAAYYQAASAQTQAGDAVQIAQIQAQSGTAQALIAGSTSVTNNTTWANTDLSTVQSNNSVAPVLAQEQTNQTLISALAGVASLPGTTTTSTTHGFLGGGGTYTTYTPNAAAVNASQELASMESLLGTGLHANH